MEKHESEKLKKKLSSDLELNALKRLKEIQTDLEMKSEIQNFIDERIAVLASEE